MPNWNTAVKSFWVQNIPSPVNGYIPNWGNIKNSVTNSFLAGRIITLVDGGQIYIATALTSTVLRFEGRLSYSYPNNQTATLAIRSVVLSTGQVETHSVRLQQTSFT